MEQNAAKIALGIEFGSTRIKAVAIDEQHIPASSGDYTWKSGYKNGVWTYDLAEAWAGLKAALSGVEPAGALPHLAEHHHRAGCR